ncbi:hypothetical protein [Zhouia amylolytica]|uniref:hypothetical protein n=1 Tax=Zhouia amylolytica TaxID=376730 RepID=UPI0020CDE361|nr:hypothetical protein [Zhouia amylolytica]MCQ0113031.1 hypothetical protein [Zhouia amylolytica]
MRVLRKDLSIYLGITAQKVKKHYDWYLDVLNLDRNYLTVFDVAKVDNIPVHVVAESMNFPKEKLTILTNIKQ